MIGKDGFYTCADILKRDSQYKMIYGGRNNGKSYSVKEHAIKCAFKDNAGNKLCYVRRWEKDTRVHKVEKYFLDMNIKKITRNKYDCIKAGSGDIYLTDSTKKNPRMHIGYYHCLAESNQYKSLNFPNVANFIFEEFQDEKGYLMDEITKFNSVISTVSRLEMFTVWMIGNALDRSNPYFTEYSLENVIKQEKDTIDRYEYINSKGEIIKIDVERVRESSATQQRMIIGKSADMINGGEWQSKSYPRLEGVLADYTQIYRLAIKNGLIWHIANVLIDTSTNNIFVYVYPYTKKDVSKLPVRRICEDFNLENEFQTIGLVSAFKGDMIFYDLVKRGKVCFSDNLTGTEFTRNMQRLNARGV